MSDNILDLPEFMERVQDDKELLLELLDIFSADFEEKRVALKEAVAQSDFEAIRQIAHSLKGASGNISAKLLREVFLKMETNGKEETLEGLDGLLQNMDEAYAALQERMTAVKAELQ